MTKFENARDYERLFWNGGDTLTVCEEPDEKRIYDLEERTARFGEAIIDFAKTIPQSAVTHRIIGQLNWRGDQCWRELRRSRRCGVEERIPKKHRHLPKRSARNQTLPSDGGSRRAGVEARSSKALGGGERIAPHLLEDLEEWEMNLVIQASSLLRPSSFVIRHFPYA